MAINERMEAIYDHKFHQTIGKILQQVIPDGGKTRLILDNACTGNTKERQHIPLFTYLGDKSITEIPLREVKSKVSNYCMPDGLILRSFPPDEVIAIIEIEFSNTSTTNVCGKFMMSALSSCYIHRYDGNKPIPIAVGASFIQILVRTAAMRKDYSILERKMDHISKRINQVLDKNAFNIKSYSLIIVENEPSTDDVESLRAIILKAISFQSL